MFLVVFGVAQGWKLPDMYLDFIPDLKSLIGKSFFGILQILPRNLKISAESRVVAGVLGSSLEFVPEIFWAESVHDLIGHLLFFYSTNHGCKKRNHVSLIYGERKIGIRITN